MFNFKKMAAVVFAAVIIAVPFAVNAQYEDINADKNSINIVVDSERVIADNFLYNDTTYVQLRKITEMLGKKVEWVESENAAYISDTDTPEITDTTVIKLTEEKGKVLSVERNTITIYVNGKKVEGDNFLFEDRTYVPLRKIAEMFENTVSWDQLTNTATIGAKKPSVFDGEVLGTINGKPYTKKLLDDYTFMYKTLYQLSSLSAEEEAAIFDQIKQDYVVMELALQLGISTGVTFENEYNETIAYFIEQLGSKDALKELFVQNGYSEELYYYLQVLSNITDQITATPIFTVTPEEAKAYYDENLDAVFKYDGVRAKHILVMPVADENSEVSEEKWAEAKTKADEVYALAISGSNFDELIAKYNEDPGVESNPNGYIFTRGEMVEEFETMAYSLEVGQISEPVKTMYGYHIIKLEEKIPYYEYDEEVENFLITELASDRFYTYIFDLTDKSVVEEVK